MLSGKASTRTSCSRNIRRFPVRRLISAVVYNSNHCHGKQEACTDEPDIHSTYASLLRLHGEKKSLSAGMLTHGHLISDNYEGDAFLSNLNVQMYAKCGALHEAHFLLAQMYQRDVFVWTFIISAYAQTGQVNQVFCLFGCMLHEAVFPSSFTFVEMLSACGKGHSLVEGKRVHACIPLSSFEQSIVVENTLLNFYGKCGHLGDAQKVFMMMEERDVVSWNSMLTACNQHEDYVASWELFQTMSQHGLLPNKVTLRCLSDACIRKEDLHRCKWVHTYIVGSGLDTDVDVGNTLISTYARCGSLKEASLVFDCICEPNVVTWTTLISGLIEHKHCKQAIMLLQQMLIEGVLPHNVTFLTIISACAGQEDLDNGMRIHAQVGSIESKMDVQIGNSLINLYGKCKMMKRAKMVFDEMPVRDEVSWNSLLTVHSVMGDSMEALKLFREMAQCGMNLDRVTLVNVLEACVNELILEDGMRVHTHVYCSWPCSDAIVGSALINMYSRCGSLEDAQEVFNKVSDPTVVLWTALIAAYAQHGASYQAVQVFEQMKMEGTIPDELALSTSLSACGGQEGSIQGKWMHACIVGCGARIETNIGNSLMNMYASCGSLHDAKTVFKRLTSKSLVEWTTIVTACAQNRQPEQALLLFELMESDGVLPNMATFTSLLHACASLAALAEGNRLYELLLVGGFEPDVVLGTALVTLYSKCSSMEDARRVFNRMPEQNMMSWNALISGYCQVGDTDSARLLFCQMQQKSVKPDDITFLTIISSFSHAGLVDEAFDYFLSMAQDYHIIPTMEHFNCLIDVFGRAGCLDKVEGMIKQFPFDATSHAWMSLLNACKVHLDVERGERTAKTFSKLKAKYHAPRVLLSNIYASAGRFKEAEMVRNKEKAISS